LHHKSTRKLKKFRLLLDSAFPKPTQFAKLSSKAHLEHVVYTLNMPRTSEDKFIYQKATKANCIVVTIDDDFKKLAKPRHAGVIIVPPDLSVKQLEESILKFIKGKNPDNYIGKSTKI
jgi:predicted nuclease of predicted toxin-antitoxin system